MKISLSYNSLITTLLVVAFIFYPTWLLSSNLIVTEVRIFLFISLIIFIFLANLHFSKRTQEKTHFEFDSNESWRKPCIQLSIIALLTTIFYQVFVFTPISSGADEPSHIYAVYYINQIISLKQVGTITGRISTLLILGALIIGSIYLVVKLEKYIDAQSINKFKLISFIIGLVIGSLSFTGILHYFIQNYTHLLVPQTFFSFVRFPPIHVLLGNLFIGIFGFSGLSLRILSIFLFILMIYFSFKLVEDLTDLDSDNYSYILLSIFTLFILSNPVYVAFSSVFYQTTGEGLFFVISVRYILKYLKTDNLHDLEGYSFYVLFGLLYRRTLIILMATFVMLYFVKKKNLYYNVIKMRSKVYTREILYELWLVFVPIFVGLVWIINATLIPNGSTNGRKLQLSKLSLNPFDKFTIYDYFILSPQLIGWTVVSVVVISVLLYLFKYRSNKQKISLILSILTIISLWYISLETDGSWAGRVDRFIAPAILLWFVLLFVFIIDFKQKIPYKSQRITRFRLNKHQLLTIFLLIILLNLNFLNTQQERNNDANIYYNQLVYPFEPLAQYFKTNFIGSRVALPFHGVNSLFVYQIQLDLSQTFRNIANWANSSNSNYSEFVQYLKVNNFTILIIPQETSPFITQSYKNFPIISNKLWNSIVLDQKEFSLKATFVYNQNSLFVYQVMNL